MIFVSQEIGYLGVIAFEQGYIQFAGEVESFGVACVLPVVV